jgi:CubicO group peptidase (beta-lactamase class C family)
MNRWMLGAALVGAFVVAAPAAWSQANLGLPQAPPEQVGMSKQKLDRIHDALKQDVGDGKLAGTVVLVARKGKLAYADATGFQDKEEGKQMALDSIFRIYSMTKPLVAVAAMMLVEDGKIELTDPVSKFLPAFKGQQVSLARADGEFARVTYATVPADREMIVQDLLRHTAGLAYGEITTNAPVKDAYAKAGLYLAGRIDCPDFLCCADYDRRSLRNAEHRRPESQPEPHDRLFGSGILDVAVGSDRRVSRYADCDHRIGGVEALSSRGRDRRLSRTGVQI